MGYFDQFLKEDEDLIRVVRRFWLANIFPIVFSAFLLLACFFILAFLWSNGLWGQIGWGVFLFVSVILNIRTWVIVFFDSLLVTDRRVVDVDQKGLFSRVVTEVQYTKVQDVSYTVKGVFETVFRLGTLVIQTASAKVNIEMKHVRKPQELQHIITDLTERHSDTRVSGDTLSDLSADELLALVKKVRRSLGDDRFEKIVDLKSNSKRV